VGVGWAPFDTAAKLQQENLLTNTYVAALRKLAPNMGAYVNEVCVLLHPLAVQWRGIFQIPRDRQMADLLQTGRSQRAQLPRSLLGLQLSALAGY
jgi:hypothetical protein